MGCELGERETIVTVAGEAEGLYIGKPHVHWSQASLFPMSDHIPPPDDDLSLPKATVAKMITGSSPQYIISPYSSFIQELLPADLVCAKETRDLVIECCVGNIHIPYCPGPILKDSPPEFIHLISSEANEICEQESKKTIAPDHIITALKVTFPYIST